MKPIGIAFDGGGTFGFGNISRSKELASELSRRDSPATLIPLSETAAALSGIALPGPIAPLRGLIIDVPYSAKGIAGSLGFRENRAVALDDEAEGAFTAINSDPSARLGGSRCYCGLKYVVVRREIRELKPPLDSGDYVLVSIGGGDFSGLERLVVGTLQSIQIGPIVLVRGPNSSELEPLRLVGIREESDPDAFPGLLANARVLVTTGGLTLTEGLYLNKPTFSIPRTRDEERFVDEIPSTFPFLGSGLNRLHHLQELTENVEMNPDKPAEALVDGLGGKRIVDIALEVATERRTATFGY